MSQPKQRNDDLEGRTRTTDSKGRVILPKEFADSLVMIDVIDEFEIRIRKVVAIPEREIWLWKNPQALQSVLTGIEQARAGEFVEAPDIDAALHDLGDEAEAED